MVSSLPPWLGFIVWALHVMRMQCNSLAGGDRIMVVAPSDALSNCQTLTAPSRPPTLSHPYPDCRYYTINTATFDSTVAPMLTTLTQSCSHCHNDPNGYTRAHCSRQPSLSYSLPLSHSCQLSPPLPHPQPLPALLDWNRCGCGCEHTCECGSGNRRHDSGGRLCQEQSGTE